MQELAGASLAERTTLRLGGPASRLVVTSTEDELVSSVIRADAAREPVLVLGGGSNLVVADDGFPGVVVAVTSHGVEERPAPGGNVAVTALAGVDWDELVERCVGRGLAGIEALSGIPGLVGASPIQNVGAYGQEVADTVTAVRVLDRHSGDVVTLTPDRLGFTYRGSIFKGGSRYVVLAVTFALIPGGESRPVTYTELARTLGVEIGASSPVGAVRDAVLALRRGKGMVLDPADHDTWSAGSFFTNPLLSADAAANLPAEAPRWPAGDGRVKISAAWLIEQSGFARGFGAGPVRLSTKHTLALTNTGAACTEDLLALARQIRSGVAARFGVELTPEPVLVGCAL